MNQADYIKLQVALAKQAIAYQQAVLVGQGEEQEKEEKVVQGFSQGGDS